MFNGNNRTLPGYGVNAEAAIWFAASRSGCPWAAVSLASQGSATGANVIFVNGKLSQ